MHVLSPFAKLIQSEHIAHGACVGTAMSDEDQRARLGVFLPQTVRSYLLGNALEGEAFPPFR